MEAIEYSPKLNGGKMRILQFSGNGQGMMKGIQEYIVILEDDNENTADDHCCPGFELNHEYKFDDDGQSVHCLPCSYTLAVLR